jgi:hypothetical protein
MRQRGTFECLHRYYQMNTQVLSHMKTQALPEVTKHDMPDDHTSIVAVEYADTIR